MRYVQRDLGEAAEASSGGGGRRVVREILILSAITLAALVILNWVLIFAAEITVRNLTIEQELELFSKVDSLPGWYSADQSDEKTELAHIAMQRLMESPKAPPVELQLVFSDSAEMNAFAVPGGVILVTRGLLDQVESEEEIAMILGHEIGHFVNRDHLRRYSRQIGTALAFGILLGNAELADLIKLGDQMVGLSTSRHQERLADEYGLELAISAYGADDSFSRMMQKLYQQETLPDWATFLSTHPGGRERVQAIRQRLQQAQKSGSDRNPDPLR